MNSEALRSYTERMTTRGGGEGGLKDCTESVGLDCRGADVTLAAAKTVLWAGRTNMSEAVKKLSRSWQQDIEQFTVPACFRLVL